jgi:hypothetical protein
MSDSKPVGNPLASFMSDLINDQMLQPGHPQIIVTPDNCAVAPSWRSQSYRKQHLVFLASSVSAISRWDSHPIRVEKHDTRLNDSPFCTNTLQRKPQCPRRTTSFEGYGVKETTSNGKLNLHKCPPKPPARLPSIESALCVGWSRDSSDDDDSWSYYSSASLLSSKSSLVRANTWPVLKSDPIRLSTSTDRWGEELSAKMKSERWNRPCKDLASSGDWIVRPPLLMKKEIDDQATLHHRDGNLTEGQREQCASCIISHNDL